METLLIVAIVMTTLAVVVQAGILLSMYLMAKRVTDNVNGLVNESHKLLAPMERIAVNFKAASDDLVIIGKDAKEEMQRIQITLAQTNEAVRTEITDLRDRVHDTADEIQSLVMEPVREWTAIANGITTGVKTFFRRRERVEPAIEIDLENQERLRDYPAA